MIIENKTILITGGGSGIGLAIAKKLSSKGAKIIISGRNKEKLENAKSQNPHFDFEVCDVTNDEQIASLVSKMKTKYNGIDILINNAGVFESIDYSGDNQSMLNQEREVNIDFLGPIRMVHHFLPELKIKSESAIVNVSSGLAFVPLAGAPVYCATKAGLHSWTRSLRYQLKKTKIKVFELMPPLVDTEMVSQFKGQKMMNPENLAEKLVKGLVANKTQITPGQASQLNMMGHLLPNFIFKILNKQFE